MHSSHKRKKKNPTLHSLLEQVHQLNINKKAVPFDLDFEDSKNAQNTHATHSALSSGSQIRVEEYLVEMREKSQVEIIIGSLRKELTMEMEHYFENEQNKYTLIDPWELVRRGTLQAGSLSRVGTNGLKRYHKVIGHLKNFPQPPSLDQQRFIEAMFAVCLPHIFGPADFEKHRKHLLRGLKRSKFPWLTTIMCPRRWGKTVSVAMAVSVLMDVCENLRIVVVSTGQKMSTALMKKIIEYYVQLSGKQKERENRILVSNEKKFVVMHAGDTGTKKAAMETGRYNSIDACASTVHGFKGVSANIILIDEASRVPEDLIVEGVSPLLTVKNTSLIMISTNLGEDNYFSQLFTNLPASFHQQVIQFHVDLLCEVCRKAKSDPRLCDHNDHLRPPWLTVGNRERSTLFMTQHKYQQEVLGTIVQDSEGELDKKWIENLLKPYLDQLDKIEQCENTLIKLKKHKKSVTQAYNHRLGPDAYKKSQQSALLLEAEEEENRMVFQQFEEKVGSQEQQLEREEAHLVQMGVNLEYGNHEVYTFIDPAGGGLQSDYAAISIVKEFKSGLYGKRDCATGRMILIGLLSLDKKDQPLYEEHLTRYFKDLCSQKRLKNATHKIGVESNYGGQPLAFHILRIIQKAGVRFKQLEDPSDNNKQHTYGLWTSKPIKMHGMAQLAKYMEKKEVLLASNPLCLGRVQKGGVVRELSEQLKRLRYKNGKYTAKKFPDGKDDMVICMILLFYYISMNQK